VVCQLTCGGAAAAAGAAAVVQVRYLGFQFASIKTFNMIQAVASVAIHDVCRVRNTATCTFK
jgi:hypothetical protein